MMVSLLVRRLTHAHSRTGRGRQHFKSMKMVLFMLTAKDLPRCRYFRRAPHTYGTTLHLPFRHTLMMAEPISSDRAIVAILCTVSVRAGAPQYLHPTRASSGKFTQVSDHVFLLLQYAETCRSLKSQTRRVRNRKSWQYSRDALGPRGLY
jgi:hypothetical protein